MEFTNTKRKRTRIVGTFSEASPDGTISEQTIIERVDGVYECDSYLLADCGHALKSGEIMRDRWTGRIVCEACLVICSRCGRKVWVEVASKIGEAYLCPDHRLSGTIMLAVQALVGRKGR